LFVQQAVSFWGICDYGQGGMEEQWVGLAGGSCCYRMLFKSISTDSTTSAVSFLVRVQKEDAYCLT